MRRLFEEFHSKVILLRYGKFICIKTDVFRFKMIVFHFLSIK